MFLPETACRIIHSKESGKHVSKTTPDNQITLLTASSVYFSTMIGALDKAQQDIYLESYIFKNDTTGRNVAASLCRAALRGVKTHLLIDGFGSNRLPNSMVDELVEAGVLVLKFQPQISPWTFRRRRLRRLHRKIVVVDAKIAFVGGLNISDDRTSPHFDFAVKVEGPLVKAIYTSCCRVWSLVARINLRPGWSRSKNRTIPPLQSRGNIRATFLVRDNFRHRRDIENAYLQAIDAAHNEIIIANPYFLPGLNFRHALSAAARRGVRVVLLLQGRADHRLFQFASRALYGSFLDAEIEIYEYHKSFLHAKVAVIDNYWATVGSSNLDPFSLLLALEANIVVYDQNFAIALKDELDQAITIGARRFSENSWRSQPLRLRLACWLSYGLVRFMVGVAGYAPDNKKKKETSQ